MTIQQKVSAVMAIVMLLFGGMGNGVLQFQIMPAFATLEDAATEADLTRAENALLHEYENISRLTGDWAPWDDSYYFVQGKNDAFKETNLDAETMSNLVLDVVLFLDNSGSVVLGRIAGEIEGVQRKFRELEFSASDLASLLEHDYTQSLIDGMVKTAQGLLVFSSRPIVTG
ncbi:MAG: sensor domain CHASE-containing protein [Halioglobus sp.]|jgi:sensor domain CHASE-containing protein